jgi:hypothetical protein
VCPQVSSDRPDSDVAAQDGLNDADGNSAENVTASPTKEVMRTYTQCEDHISGGTASHVGKTLFAEANFPAV